MVKNTREEKTTIYSAFPLAGTITIPEGIEKAPAIIMIHGSGPVDRDENVKQLAINAFKELSDFIAPLGFVTIRYDKRGVGESGGSFIEAGLWDLVDDAEAVIQFAKKHPNVDPNRIILLGHSEGCLISPALNKRQNVQGMILLAGAVGSLKDTIDWQREMLGKEILSLGGFSGFLIKLLNVEKKMKTTNEAFDKRVMEGTETVFKFKGRKMNAKWTREHFLYNCSDDLKDVNCPTLAITGTKDVQVKPDDAEKIASLVKGPSEFHLIENMTHLLRKDDINTNALKILKNYKKSVKLPLETELLSLIEKWLFAYFQ